ncbi:MAG: CIA30 family protein [Gammaproteobacteria bacterium]|nr:CIA30 family protein [Gammaproteobacteria bacterium]MDJ0873515.1 CIA30 family protein [Gammaproteobacteria bacterium]MDJ0892875.1 CIA30 family protein [Gammaproteobacteria bacterium]
MRDQSEKGNTALPINTAMWRIVTDTVMGGMSEGTLELAKRDGRRCLRLQGQVRTANGGGFIKAGLKLKDWEGNGLAESDGIMIDVSGNAERYNVHLRTTDMRLPWQSYRQSFLAPVRWTRVTLPFADFEPHRISAPLRLNQVVELSLVAIGREFSADLCVSRLSV